MMELYAPEQQRQQRIGARLLLMKLLNESGSDWNGFGINLWVGNELRRLEEEECESES